MAILDPVDLQKLRVRGIPVQTALRQTPTIPGPRQIGQAINQLPAILGAPLAGIANIASAAKEDFLSGITGAPSNPTTYEGKTLRQLLTPASAPAVAQAVSQAATPAVSQAPAPVSNPVAAPTPNQTGVSVEQFDKGGMQNIEPPRSRTPDGQPVFSTGGPLGGTAQLGSGPAKYVPNDFGAGRTNVVSNIVPYSGGGSASTYNPNSVLNFTPSTGGGLPLSKVEQNALARSRQIDGAFQQLMAQVQKAPQSYGELFARKGKLAALNELAALAQAAGTNYIQGAGDVLSADTNRYGTDRQFQIGRAHV